MIHTHYQGRDSRNRGYDGVFIEEERFRAHLADRVRKSLLDSEEQEILLQSLLTLQADTGFHSSSDLLADIQALSDEEVQVRNFRVGEAYAEVILEDAFQCRFYWNELRDARNPKGNKTGADLVGFIEVEGQVLFLFGEVKTSSETANIPPQVMTSADGIERQLAELYNDRKKRLILVSYLQNKARLHDAAHPFHVDFQSALRNYYLSYQLIGVLIRDTTVNESDLSVSYGRLKTQVLDPIGLQLLAIYVPILQRDWLAIINTRD
jgi:hypothetical protein